ncbi:MAG TPA: hypothetical protein VIG06_27435 [Kofleriaceae bacterium]
MRRAASDAIARAVLYEGYVLYPYRPSALKNRQRWTFGGLAPRPGADAAAAEPWSMQTQVLVAGGAGARVEVRVRFLQLVEASGQDWQQAIEREVAVAPAAVGDIAAIGREERFRFESEPAAGRSESVAGAVEIAAEPFGEAGIHRLTVAVHNLSPGAGPLRRMASTHTVIEVTGGALVSLMDPPPALAAAAASCVNIGTWPVLVGPPGSSDTMLSSPIVLHDHPEIAPESGGDLFDSTEIDEILVLRVLTLTDEEKAAAAACDPRVREMLARVEAMSSADLMQLHGALRQIRREVGAGARVRLRPRGRADALDIALAGRTATVVAVEQDQEGRLLFGVAVDDDPGRDLAAEGLPGHRFFFRLEEIEVLP